MSQLDPDEKKVWERLSESEKERRLRLGEEELKKLLAAVKQHAEKIAWEDENG